MRIIHFCSLALLIMWSCKQNPPPKAILSQQEMVDLLIKVYLAESRVIIKQTDKDARFLYYLAWQDSLMNRLNISDSVFQKSYTYYFEHPKILEDIYDTVIDSLYLYEKRFQKVEEDRKE